MLLKKKLPSVHPQENALLRLGEARACSDSPIAAAAGAIAAALLAHVMCSKLKAAAARERRAHCV